MKKYILAALMAVLIVGVLAGTASATPWLSKTRANNKAYAVSGTLMRSTGGYHRSVGLPEKCVRFASNRVGCAYAISYSDDITCGGAVMVTLTNYGTLRYSFPLEPDCS